MNTIIKEKITDESDFFIQSNSGYIYHITEGTGDNLSQEDIDDGYVDYIYYDVYATLGDVHDDYISDGGMVLLTEPYVNLSIKDIIARVMDLAGDTYGK